MTEQVTDRQPATAGVKGQSGRIRDWILMPALSLATIVLTIAGCELLARETFSRSRTAIEGCMEQNDSTTGIRAIPKSVCVEKYPESDRVEYRFNGCGHRAGIECGPPAPGVFRIVVVGSSMAIGARVKAEQVFTASLESKLSRETDGNIEVYNAAVYREHPATLAMKFQGILALKPNVILWALTPIDIRDAEEVVPVGGAPPPPTSFASFAWRSMKESFGSQSFSGALRTAFNLSRTATVVRHLLYLSRTLYLSSVLMGDDAEIGFLRRQKSSHWQASLKKLDVYAGMYQAQAEAAGVPLVTVLIPERGQAAMIAEGEWPTEFDPYEIGNDVRGIVASRGGIYIDLLSDYRRIATPEDGFFPVDGHLNAQGHTTLASLLAEHLTGEGLVTAKVASTPGGPRR